MIELAKHIEVLLLENDCVIIPDLGGFITHYQPAYYEEKEGIYLPPVRTIGFNPQLTMNDGLLTQSYMQTYHTDFPDALRRISAKVELLKDLLYKDGFVELNGIGTLQYNIYNTYEFQPYSQGLLSPSLYGLDSFHIPMLSLETENKSIPSEPSIPLPKKEQNAKEKEIILRRNWFSNAVAAAIAIILFFCLSAPVENTYIDKGYYASLGTDCLFDVIRSHSMATSLFAESPQQIKGQQINKVAPVAVKVEKVAATPKEDSTPKHTEKTKMAETKEKPKHESTRMGTASPRKVYHIIVASLTTSADAKQMQQQYQKQGHTESSIIDGNGRFRIALYSYTDKTSAYQKLNDLKQEEAFKNAWILTSKKD